MVAMCYDYVRSAAGPDRQCWAAEFQGGPISTSLHKGRTPSPEDIRLWVLTALSSGIQGLSFWNHRVETFWHEAYGFGLLDSRGDHSPRATEAGRLSKSINRYPDLFHEGRVPRADVALLINEDLWHFSEATGDGAASHLSFTIRSLYKMLWQSGVWVDFVEVNHTSSEDLGRYRAIILPLPLSLDHGEFDMLEGYVAKGGTLISEACPGRYDRFGFTRPGELAEDAEEIFGVEHRSVQLCQELRQTPRWIPAERSYGEIRRAMRFQGTGPFAGHSVLPSLYIETYTVKGSSPILLCEDEVVGVVNGIGRGRCYLIGTVLGHAHSAFRDEATLAFLLSVLNGAGIKPELCGKLRRRRRVGEGQEAWFMFNMSSDHIAEGIDVSGFSAVEDLVEGPLAIQKGSIVTIGVDPFHIRCLILRR